MIFILTTNKLFKLARNDKFLLFCMLFFTAVAAWVYMIIPMITRIVVDNIINDIPFAGGFLIATIVALFGGIETLQSHIWLAGLMLVFVTTLQAFFVFVRQRFAALASERIVKRLKDELYDHIQKLPYDYHVKAQTGDLIQRCTSDVETIRIFYHSQLIEIVRAVFMVIFALGAMVSVNIRMTFVSILFLPFVFLFSFVFFRYVKKTFQSQAEKEGEMTTVLQESLSGIRVTRAFGRGRFEMERFIEKNDAYRDVSFRLIHYLGYYWSLSDFLRFTQTAIVLVYGIMQTYQGVITVGELILFNAYVQMMVWPVSQLGRVLTDTGKAQVASNRVYEVLETAAESDNENAVDYDLKGDIVFDDVSFAYEKDKKILDGLSFTVKKGETIAILGATGAGKSTLMHILLRLYDYQTGSITINGKELNLIRKDCLRSKIGMVLQEPFLYSKTIENNLRMAKESVEQDEMIKATNIAAIHDVIEDFEKGYDTLVGEKGVTLSGGQKQRVAIARTLIKNSEILIFDDSLSAVDTETDAEIRAALEKRNKDVTTFIISQRITTLMDADRIFVIDGGILADSGTHQELLGRDGLYSRIWQIQAMLEQDIKMKQSE